MKYFALVSALLLEIDKKQYEFLATWNDEYLILDSDSKVVTIWQQPMKPKRKIKWPDVIYLVNPENGFIYENSHNMHRLFAIKPKLIK
jgi:hypothetical protein